jgi:hypothetical protein
VFTPLPARYRLPAAYPFRFFTEIGQPTSYGTNRPIIIKRGRLMSIVSSRVGRKAPGKRQTRAGETAKALGLTVPPTLLTRRASDRVAIFYVRVFVASSDLHKPTVRRCTVILSGFLEHPTSQESPQTGPLEAQRRLLSEVNSCLRRFNGLMLTELTSPGRGVILMRLSP